MNTIIELTSRERDEFERLLRLHPEARQYQRALALLLLDEGERVEEVAGHLHVSPRTVYNWLNRFEQRSGLSPAERLRDAARSGRPATAQGVIDPLIDEIIEADPRDLGYNSGVWTAALLRQYLGETHRQWVGLRSIGLALARLRIHWKHPRHVLARRDPFLAAVKRGLKKGLWTRERAVMLMLDETIITATPPLYCGYGRAGRQVGVPITGTRAKRVLHGALNLLTGEVLLSITEVWDEVTPPVFSGNGSRPLAWLAAHSL